MKAPASGDPLELVAVPHPREIDIEADRETARCLIEEYALTGFAASEIFTLFSSPVYVMPHAIFSRRGAGFIRELMIGVFGEGE